MKYSANLKTAEALRLPYQSPISDALQIAPSQIICGSNESIDSGNGDPIDWVIGQDSFIF